MCPVTTDARGAATTTNHAEHVREHGWASVPDLGVSPADLAEVRALLDGLMDRFDELPVDKAVDLGVGGAPGRPVVPEVLDCAELEPRLRGTAVWRAAHRVARDVLGPGTFAIYDHAIYKPPAPTGATSWHQDAGFDHGRETGLAVWIPFQDTDVVDGCMRYVSGSHRLGRQEHLVRIGPNGKEVHHLEVDGSTATDVPCRVGGATMHDFYTVHGAGANVGEQVRRAWVIDFHTGSPARRAVRRAKRLVRSLRG